jgi:hypothetical protein
MDQQATKHNAEKKKKYFLRLLFQNVLHKINLRTIIIYTKNKKRRTKYIPTCGNINPISA